MHALVTGGTVFIGSHLVERLLAAGHCVRVLARDVHKAAWLVRQGAKVHAGDVTNPVSLRSAATDVDVVFHLAAFVSEWGPWKKFEAITVAGTKNTLAAAVTAGVRRFVHISTATVYDDT